MESIGQNTTVFLDSYVDTSLFDAYGSRACYSLFMHNGIKQHILEKKKKSLVLNL